MKNENIKTRYLKRVITYYYPYIGKVILSGVCAILVSLTSLAFPMGFGQIIDFLVTENYMRASYTVFILILFVVFREALLYIGATTYGMVNNSVVCDVRKDMFKHMMSMRIGYFNKQKNGAITSLFVNDINAVQSVTAGTLFSVVTDVLTLVTVLIALFVQNWKLAIFSTFAIVLYVFVLKLERQLRELGKLSQESMANSTAVLSEAISGIKTIKTFAQERQAGNRFFDSLSQWLTITKNMIYKKSMIQSIVSLITNIGPYIVLLLGVLFVRDDTLSVGSLTSIYTLLGQLYAPCRGLTQMNVVLQMGLASLTRIFDFMDLPVESTGKNTLNFNGDINTIEFDDVAFAYVEDQDVLNGLNFKLVKGERVAIVGESGAGKSTIIDLLLKLYYPIRGVIRVNGQDIQELSNDAIRECIGVVSQDVFLFQGSIAENIKFTRRDASDEEIVHAARIAGADGFIMNLPNKYDTQVGERGVQLSAGQRQRISIARAIIKQPSFIILDEATSALDAAIQQRVQADLYDYFCDKPCLVIAHRLSTIKNCDRILVLQEGTIVENGTFEELIQLKKAFWSLYSRESGEN